LVKYPFENDLKSLPLEDNFECLKSYLFNDYKKKYKKPKNLKQWFLFQFGQGICDKYLFPYNEKVWNIPVDKLSMSWSARIPNPPPDDIIRSSLGFTTEGYTHQLYYHYPLQGGYQAISEAWAKKAKPTYNWQLKKIIKTKNNKFLVSNGKETLEFDQLISTIPIQELVKLVNFSIPLQVLNAIRKLIVNPMLNVCLGINGEDRNKFTAVYFPEKEFLPNRICYPKTFSPNNAPQGTYSILADITCLKNSATWREDDQTILNHVIDGLINRGLIDNKSSVIYKKVLRSQYAYVVYDIHYEKHVKIIRDWFPKIGIHLLGRFSYFEYVNVDAVLERSIDIIGKLNKKSIDLKKEIKKVC
jgi:protoporphyrinogen oxidase